MLDARAPTARSRPATLRLGIPAVSDLAGLGQGATARRVGLAELIALAAEPPAGPRARRLGPRDVRRSRAGGPIGHGRACSTRSCSTAAATWLAYWGATIDETVQEALDAIAAALPAVCASAFDGDRDALVHDLYACAVDQIARDRLRAAGDPARQPAHAQPAERAGALPRRAHLVEPELPLHAGLAALERRLTELGRPRPRAALERTLAAQPAARRGRRRPRGDAESQSERRARAVAPGRRRPDPRPPRLAAPRRRRRGLRLPPLGRPADRRAPPARADRARPRRGRPRLRPGRAQPRSSWRRRRPVRAPHAIPRLEELGVPVLLPRNWVTSSSRLRVNLTATSVAARSSGLLTTDALARFDWKLAIGDTTLTEEELAELAAAKEPLIRVRGRWHALRRSEVERALRFLERRREGSVVDLVRAVSGIELEDAGLELGRGHARRRRSGELLAGGDDAALRAARHAGGDDAAALPVPGARPRLAAAARRPRASARSSPTTWASARPSRRSRC